MQKNDFVKITDYIPSAIVCLKYATDDNFTGKVIYSFNEAYIRYGTALKLANAAKELEMHGCRLKIWDAYRPSAAQFRMWEILPDPDFVADPNRCFSCHTRGNAVDITLTDMNGKELEMPSAFDEFGEKANRDYTSATAEAEKNATLMQNAMKNAGFYDYYEEWWHYEDPDSYPPEKELQII